MGGGVLYKTIIFYGQDYLPEAIIYVFEKVGTTEINFYDDWGNVYEVAHLDQLGHHTWQGKPVFPRQGPPLHSVNTQVPTAGPKEPEYYVPTPTYMRPLNSAFANLSLHTGRGAPSAFPKGDPGATSKDPMTGDNGGNTAKKGPQKPQEIKINPRDKLDKSRGRKEDS